MIEQESALLALDTPHEADELVPQILVAQLPTAAEENEGIDCEEGYEYEGTETESPSEPTAEVDDDIDDADPVEAEEDAVEKLENESIIGSMAESYQDLGSVTTIGDVAHTIAGPHVPGTSCPAVFPWSK